MESGKSERNCKRHGRGTFETGAYRYEGTFHFILPFQHIRRMERRSNDGIGTFLYASGAAYRVPINHSNSHLKGRNGWKQIQRKREIYICGWILLRRRLA